MTWLLACCLALAVAGAINLVISVRAMRKGGLGPVPVPPDWHPEYVPARAQRIELRWGRMQRAYLAHQWWVGRVAGVEVALGVAGAAAVAVMMDSRPWSHVLAFAGLMIVPLFLVTSLLAVTRTALARLREFDRPAGGMPGLGRLS